MTSIVKDLVVYPERMQGNLDRLGGLIHSQRLLLALTEAGVPREEAYRLVQRNAMKVWEGGADFLEALLADKDVTRVSPEQIRAQFDLGYHLKHVDTIFARVFGTK
jgi:adenylosuccinate lyase